MDRLTTETNMLDIAKDTTFAFLCYIRLKQYEDLGYSPEDLHRIIRQNNIRGQLIRSVRIEVIENG